MKTLKIITIILILFIVSNAQITRRLNVYAHDSVTNEIIENMDVKLSNCSGTFDKDTGITNFNGWTLFIVTQPANPVSATITIYETQKYRGKTVSISCSRDTSIVMKLGLKKYSQFVSVTKTPLDSGFWCIDTSNGIRNIQISYDGILDTTDVGGNTYYSYLPYGTTGTFTPLTEGYIYTPSTISFTVDTFKNHNFLAVDTMHPSVYINDIPTQYINEEDTISITAEDNSSEIKTYEFYMSYNGTDWTHLYTTPDSHYVADDTSNIQAKRIQTFTFTSLTQTAKMMVIVTDFSNLSDTAYSNTFNVIDIVGPSITATSPNGGEQWDVGSNNNITWNASDNIGIVSRSIYYTHNSTDWNLIDSATGNTGTYSWAVPNTPSTTCKVKIHVYDGSNNTAVDESDAVFEIVDSTTPDITPPVVTVLTPTANEQIQKGARRNITWTATDNKGVTNSTILFSSDSGETYMTLNEYTPDPGILFWTTPDAVHEFCFIKVWAYDSAGNKGENISGVFEINDFIKPEVTLNTPTSDSITIAEKSIHVNFNGTDNYNNNLDYSIFLSIDSGATYELKDQGNWTWTSGSRTVAIPTRQTHISEKCLIIVQISDANENTASDTSETFSIITNVPEVTILTPTADSAIVAGKPISVSFKGTDNDDNIRGYSIFLSIDNGALEFITTADWTGGDLTVQVPTELSDISEVCQISIKIFDWSGNSKTTGSEIFSIVAAVSTKPIVNIPKVFSVRVTDRSLIIGMEKTAKVNISIVSLNGRTVMDKVGTLTAGYHTISRQDLAQGMYLLRIRRSDKVITRKIF